LLMRQLRTRREYQMATHLSPIITRN